jgi:thiol-disulfide isomerase/thioredoxin
MMQRVSFLAGAIASVAALPSVAAAKPGPSPSSPAPEPSEKPHVHGPNGVVTLPEHRVIEWTSEVLDGPEFRLSAYRGKVVFVNVFATWCPPCRVEQPIVVAFANAHTDDTAVIGVDVREEDNDVRAYRKKYGIPYPIAMDRYDKKVRSIYREGRMVFPTTIVFRADGTLSCAWAGDQDREWFEAEREYALQPPAPPPT